MINLYSVQFVLFLAATLVCYYNINKKNQWICLLLASIVFYSFSGIHNLLFLMVTGFSTWYGAKKIAQFTKEKSDKKRHVLWCVVFLNFGMLGYFKYLGTILRFFSIDFGMILPLGISFYMFQSIGYLVDVYYGKCEAESDFAKYMLFVSWFPQMIQGPINRYNTIQNELCGEHEWDTENAIKAFYRIGYGLLKKYAIANVFSGMIANIFDNPAMDYSGGMVIVGILMYSLQQYADFSGGIDMVLGVSELFGIHMMDNFKQPYFATSLADFWRRWHISLGKWMRDYVFYPFVLTGPMKKLGKWAKNKLGKHLGRVLPAAVGNVLVFFLVGIWHGAELHYIIWGLYNGAIIAVSDVCTPLYGKIIEFLHINTKTWWYRIFQIVRTFFVVNIGWFFDRITDVKIALYSIKKAFFNINMEAIADEWIVVSDGYPGYLLAVTIIACVIVFIVSILKENGKDVREMICQSSLVIRWSICLFVIVVFLFANSSSMGVGGFMYANF